MKCEDFLVLGKYYPGGWSAHQSQEDFQVFLEKHDKENNTLEDMYGEFYEFVTEGDDPKVKLYDFKERKIRLIERRN